MVFAPSQFTRDELCSLIRLDRVSVARWGVDKRFTSIRQTTRSGPFRLLFFGSLAPLKGVFDALRALGQVRCAGVTDWTFRIAGWGYEPELRAACDAHGIARQCVFLGRLDQDQLVSELEWAQAAVLPSHAESFGLSIAEAQGAGLPVISYRVGAVPEVVADGITGWLVPQGDVALLAEAITRVIQNPAVARRAGQAAQKRVKALFTWEATALKIAETMEEIRAQHSARHAPAITLSDSGRGSQ
jgi:glycosyltransferase involved in cell wall biosynthesis